MLSSLPGHEFFAPNITYVNTTSSEASSVKFLCTSVSSHPGDGSLCAIGLQLVEAEDNWALASLAIHYRAHWDAGGWKAIEAPDPMGTEGSQDQRSDGIQPVTAPEPAPLYWDRALGVERMPAGRLGVWFATDRGQPHLLTLDAGLRAELAAELRTPGSITAERS